MKILIIGGSGLLGSNLFNSFKSRYDVASPTRQILDLENSLEFTNFDNDFNVLIYCAQYRPKFNQKTDFNSLERVNGACISSFIKLMPKLQKIIYMSSGGIYKDSDVLLSENSPIKTSGEITPYFESKLKTEAMLLDLSKSFSINILRIFTMYGGGVHPTSLFPRLRDKLLKGEVINSSRDLGDRLRPVHVLDVVKTVDQLLDFNESAIFNIGGPEVLFFQDIVRKVAEQISCVPKFQITEERQNTLAPDNKLLSKVLHTPEVHFSGRWDSLS
jgi:nucleoside-diphosphate-sugar epimerase